MNKLLFSLSVCLLLISIAVFAYPGEKCNHSDRVIKQLSLNEEQAMQFREVMHESHEEMHAFRKSQHEETIEQLYSVLTAKQMQEFKQIHENCMQFKKEQCKVKQ